jgi:shikimate kinase
MPEDEIRMNIYLIGYRCSGKTTIGRSLANQLQWSFIDADEILVEQYQESISEMVTREGWTAFRQKEKEIIRRLSRCHQHVIATGGGVILDQDNIRVMKSSGTVVWLQASVASIEKRMAYDVKTGNQRPALTSGELRQEIEKTLQDRLPLYQSAMDLSVRTDELAIDEICRIVISKIKMPDPIHHLPAS